MQTTWSGIHLTTCQCVLMLPIQGLRQLAHSDLPLFRSVEGDVLNTADSNISSCYDTTANVTSKHTIEDLIRCGGNNCALSPLTFQ